jgi:hypothetical protein
MSICIFKRGDRVVSLNGAYTGTVEAVYGEWLWIKFPSSARPITHTADAFKMAQEEKWEAGRSYRHPVTRATFNVFEVYNGTAFGVVHDHPSDHNPNAKRADQFPAGQRKFWQDTGHHTHPGW